MKTADKALAQRVSLMRLTYRWKKGKPPAAQLYIDMGTALAMMSSAFHLGQDACLNSMTYMRLDYTHEYPSCA